MGGADPGGRAGCSPRGGRCRSASVNPLRVTNMGYTRNTDFLATLFPSTPMTPGCSSSERWAPCFPSRAGGGWGSSSPSWRVLAGLAFRYMPQSILWNNRVLPFWFLCLYLLSGLAVAELYAIWWSARRISWSPCGPPCCRPRLLVLVVALVWVGFPLHILPGQDNASQRQPRVPRGAVHCDFLYPGWISWNYSGYQYAVPVPAPENATRRRRQVALARVHPDRRRAWGRSPKTTAAAASCGSTSRR